MGSTGKALAAAAAGEIATGLALLLAPSFVGQLLLGTALTDISLVLARVAGIALIGLGITCWPGPPRLGMLVYSTSVALYLAFYGLTVSTAGVLLWPAVFVHVILSALLIQSMASDKPDTA